VLLEIENLRVHYGKAEALKGISLAIDDGEIITLIGSNGSGKSTTLRAVSGLKKPTSGDIRYRGKSLVGLPAHRITRLGIAHVPEGRRMLAPMSVLENLDMGAYPRDDKQEKRRNLRKVFDLFPILEKRQAQRSGSLSGGEQQMLAIARALMSQPTLILMDEPSMGLSPLLVDEVGQIIKDINKQGVSIILIEQNARMALLLANRAYVLEVGEITLQGPASEMLGDERVKKTYLGG
jgi:branched-chain amino acid transport system ATP-binding protein